MLRKIAWILVVTIMMVISTCFASEKELAHNFYYLGAAQIDNNTLSAKSKMVWADGSACVYTYSIDTKTKSSTETEIEVFDTGGKRLSTYKADYHYSYGDQSYPLVTIIVDEALNEIAEKEKQKK